MPWFHAPALDANPRYAFDTVGGRWVVLLLLGSGRNLTAGLALQLLEQNRALFDDQRACFFGIISDALDAADGRVAQQLPGIRWFMDYDHKLSQLLGAVEREGVGLRHHPHWLLVDPMLRVRSRAPLAEGARIFGELRERLSLSHEPSTAPILIVPDVFPPSLCNELVRMYERNGGAESGFMREENGVTIKKMDHAHKRRSDYRIEDAEMLAKIKGRLARSLRPMIKRAFQFDATRIERFIVACYDAADRGHFRQHRDNTTKGTAHRRFACTINLNTDAYEGGDLCFPEFGTRTYRAPTGGAIIFSCSLLHEAQPVTRGKRYAFLPFLYDDAGARVRDANLSHVAPELQNYSSGLPPLTGEK